MVELVIVLAVIVAAVLYTNQFVKIKIEPENDDL